MSDSNAAMPAEVCVVDDETMDATDAAHPAWWRGHDGVRGALTVVRCALNDPPHGGSYGSAEAREIDASIRALRAERDEARAEADRLRAEVEALRAQTLVAVPLGTMDAPALPCACDEWGQGHLDGCHNGSPSPVQIDAGPRDADGCEVTK